MTRQPVTSAMAKSVGHEHGVLEVEMANGRIYRYTPTGELTHDHLRTHFENLTAADSFGKEFQNLKKAGFTVERVDEPSKTDAASVSETLAASLATRSGGA